MVLTDGLRGFDARRWGSTPNIRAYERLTTDATRIVKGHPVVLSSGTVIQRAAVVSGLVSNTKILGFANEDSSLLASELPIQFGQLPAINNPTTGRPFINVAVADGGNIFTGALASGQSATQAVVGVSCNLRYDSANDQFSVDPSATSNGLVRIIGIVPRQENRARGLVDFVVEAVDSQYITGT